MLKSLWPWAAAQLTLVIYMHHLWVLLHCVVHAFLHFYFAVFFCFGFRIIVVVEINCEVHIAHNLKIKLFKLKCGYLFFFFFYIYININMKLWSQGQMSNVFWFKSLRREGVRVVHRVKPPAADLSYWRYIMIDYYLNGWKHPDQL